MFCYSAASDRSSTILNGYNSLHAAKIMELTMHQSTLGIILQLAVKLRQQNILITGKV